MSGVADCNEHEVHYKRVKKKTKHPAAEVHAVHAHEKLNMVTCLLVEDRLFFAPSPSVNEISTCQSIGLKKAKHLCSHHSLKESYQQHLRDVKLLFCQPCGDWDDLKRTKRFVAPQNTISYLIAFYRFCVP